jgi:hypothetical protein
MALPLKDTDLLWALWQKSTGEVRQEFMTLLVKYYPQMTYDTLKRSGDVDLHHLQWGDRIPG